MTNIVIIGSNRDNSNTLRALKDHLIFLNYELIELHKLKIEHYVYNQQQKPQDDFLAVAHKMAAAQNIVFATPVYWYSMSGIMKVLFDRFSDLISTSKPIGRALAGKSTFLFATGSDATLPEGFEVPFKKTSDYFAMNYKGAQYIPTLD